MRMRRKVGYAIGDLGISVSYFAVGFFFIYYLTDIVGMDPARAGLAFFLGKLWDGVNDPIMGVLSDRTHSRWGRKRVYVLFGALPLAASFMLLWTIPVHAAPWLQFVLATASITLYATAYTVVVVPYMALVPVMSGDYDERTQIAGLRAMLSTVGTIFGAAMAMLLAGFTDAAFGVRSITAGFAAVTLITLLVAAQSVRDIDDKAAPADESLPLRLRPYIALVRDRNVALLLTLKLSGAIGTGVLLAAIPYFAGHVLGDPSKSTIGVAVYVLVSALSIPLWTLLTHRYDKRRLLLAGNVASAAVLSAISFTIQPGQFAAFYFGCAALGVTMSAYLLIPYSLVPDMVEYYEHRTGERHESVFFGLWITVHQLGISIAGLALGQTLAAFGYDGTVGVQTAAAVFAVRLALGVLPGAALVLGAGVVQFYGVTRQVYTSIRDDLQQPPGPDAGRAAATGQGQ